MGFIWDQTGEWLCMARNSASRRSLPRTLMRFHGGDRAYFESWVQVDTGREDKVGKGWEAVRAALQACGKVGEPQPWSWAFCMRPRWEKSLQGWQEPCHEGSVEGSVEAGNQVLTPLGLHSGIVKVASEYQTGLFLHECLRKSEHFKDSTVISLF